MASLLLFYSDKSLPVQEPSLNEEYVEYSKDPNLPLPPEKPLESDCCGQGCNPCVFDIYESDITKWVKNCRRILSSPGDALQGIDDNQLQLAIILAEFTSLQISYIRKISENLIIYRFKIPNNKSIHMNPGQHLILGYKVDGSMLTRQYTPVSAIDTVGYFDVFIKIYEHGKMSEKIRQWQVGDYALWRGPFGNFQYRANKYKKIIMLAAGTGVAPMIQIMRYVTDNENDDTCLHLILAVKYYDDLALKAELDDLKQYWNVTIEYILSCEKDVTKFKYGDKITLGRIDYDFLEKVLLHPSSNFQVLICGTKSFEKDMIKYLIRSGLAADNYYRF